MTAITVRDVPEPTRRALAARAAGRGQSLQEFLRGELIELADRPSVDEVLGRARARTRATGARLTTQEILSARDADRR